MNNTNAGGLAAAAADAQHGLRDAPAFFAAVRPLFGGALKRAQVDGLMTILAAIGGWPLAFAAYGLATAYHETAHTMQPVREAYWLSEGWRRAHLRYYPWYGRGFVQLTWEAGYRNADAKLGLGGTLIFNPDRAMEPAIAALVMARGMSEGWFSPGHTLGACLPQNGAASEAEFEGARRIINGTDRKALIAAFALKFQTALLAGGWR